jgi:aspartate/methionine/tyrosine aminotransferase
VQAPEDVLDTGTLPNCLTDARLIADHRGAGRNTGELIYLSLGETWANTAPGLIAALRQVPAHAHGYTLSPYGLPALRRVLRSYVTRTHGLTTPRTGDFDVSVSQSGTRAAMSDFGQLVSARGSRTALVPTPGWDYAGVLAPLGLTIRPYGVTADHSWQPHPDQVERLLRTGHRGSTLLILNPQHNPTGSNWSPSVVTRMIRAAIAREAPVLLDDAYFAVHTPGRESTSALRILLAEVATAPSAPSWLAVRTLGKQFHCNGWGIGALTAHPDTLAELAEVAHQRTYGTALPLQAAMAVWLQDPASDAYLDRLRHHYSIARRLVAQRLIDTLGFPDHAVHPGTCTSYLRFQVPPHFVINDDEEHYRRLCLDAGVLPGRGSMTETTPMPNRGTHVRIHLGQPVDILDQALTRLQDARLGWR